MTWTPAPGVAFVRPVSTEETAGGRIILPDMVRDRWTRCQAEVVAVGPPDRCDDDECRRRHGAGVDLTGKVVERCHAIEVKPGDWVLIPPRSLLPAPERDQYVVGTTDCWGVFTAEPVSGPPPVPPSVR